MKLSSAELQPRRQWRHICLLAIFMAALFSIWWILVVRMKVDIWSTNDDYAQLSLAHAVNIEYWVTKGGGRIVKYFQTFHPGVPFQFSSWIVLRVAALFYPASSGDLVSYTLRNPELFWLANQSCAVLLTAAGLVGIGWLSRRLDLGFAAVALMVFFCVDFTWTYGLLRLGNESFALPLSVAFFGLSQRTFQAGRTKLLLWAMLGALGGIAYLVKLNYIVWPIAVGIGLFTQLFVRSINRRQFISRMGYFLIGFCGGVFALGTLFLRCKGLGEMITQHWGVISHTGYYGAGQGGLLAWDGVFRTLQNVLLFRQTWSMSLLFLFLILGVLFWHRADQDWLKENLPFAVCLGCAIVLGYASAVKHFYLHYLIPTFAVIPVVVLWLGKSVDRRVNYLIAIVVLVAVLISGVSQFRQRSLAVAYAKSMEKDLDRIDRLPVSQRHFRLWAYRVEAPAYLTSFVVTMASIPAYYRELDLMFAQDAACNASCDKVSWHGTWVESSQIPWEYAIFTRAVFPTFRALPAYFQQNGKEVSGFDKVLVVVRNYLQ